MALLRLISLGALAVVGAATVAPSTARACSIDPCADSGEFGMLRVTHESVTTDGVLLLSSQQGDSDALSPQDAIARMTVVVTEEDVELAGTIEHAAGEFFWRPDAPFLPGSTLSVAVSIEANPDDIQQCGASAGGESTVTVLDETLPALELPSVEVTTDYWFSEDVDFDTAVCCDDGTVNADSCNTPSFGGTGFCVAPSGTGYATGSLTLGELPENLGPGVAVEYLVDGDVVHSQDGTEPLSWGISRPAAFDVQVRITSLIDGSSLETDAVTVDGDNPDGLGKQVVDVAAELEANCEGEPYTCETQDEFAWDPEDCTPYDDGGGTDTDAGGSDSDTDTGGSDSDSESGGSESDSAGSDTDGSSSDSDTAASGSDTDGDPGQDGGGGGCSVGGRGLGGASLLLLGFAGVFRRRRE